MMLVVSLFISSSYDKIAGYAPGSQVTDHNAIDLDQKVMEDYLKAGDFAKALKVYTEGGNSRSYAALTVPATAKGIRSWAAMTATDQQGATVIGRPHDNYEAGSTSIGFRYNVYTQGGKSQWNADGTPGHNDCRVGGMESGDAYYKAAGCVDESQPVTISYEDGTTGAITPSAIEHKNGRTIQGFSLKAQRKMYDDCPGCPYEDYTKFYEYYGSHTYADDWVTAALTGGKTEFTRGNIDFTVAIKTEGSTAELAAGAPGSPYHDGMRKQAAKKGTAYMNVWMYVIREFEDAIDDCTSNCIACNDDPAHAWDEGVAFWTGSLEKEDGFSSGNLLYALAEKRCQNFKTCGSHITAKVNYDLFYQFAMGQHLLRHGRCDELRPVVRRVVSLMTIPLIQGTLRYNYKKYVSDFPDDDDDPGAFADIQAKSAVYAAAILPMVHACNADDAKTIYNLTKIDSTYPKGAARPDFSAWVKLKTAFENNYACLGITCADIGGLWGITHYGAADGRRLSELVQGYFEGAEPCSGSVVNSSSVPPGSVGNPAPRVSLQ